MRNITEYPQFVRPEKIAMFDVVKVPINGVGNQFVVIMDHLWGLDKELLAIDIFPIDRIAKNKKVDKDQAFGILFDDFKEEMGLPLDSNYQISFTPIRLRINGAEFLEKTGDVNAYKVQRTASNEFKKRTTDPHADSILDASTLSRLQSGKDFISSQGIVLDIIGGSRVAKSAEPEFTGFAARTLTASEPAAEDLFGSAPSAAHNMSSVEVVVKRSKLTKVPVTQTAQVTSPPRENPTISVMVERGQLSEYTGQIFNGGQIGREPGPVLNKKSKPLRNETGEIVVINNLTELHNLVSSMGAEGIAKNVSGFGKVFASELVEEVNALMKLYPQ